MHENPTRESDPEGTADDTGNLDAPRLPDRPALVEFVGPPRLAHDVPDKVRAVASPTRAALTPFGLDPGTSVMAWQEYEEPDLVDSWKFAAASLGFRVLGVVWAIWVVFLARRMQTGGITPARSDDLMTLAVAGFGVAVAIAASGSIWSTLRTINIHRLDGRLPTRVRCVTAWSLPVVVTVLGSLLILYAPPTEPADIRPLVAVLAFIASMWRPYSLVRRILASLTPATSNPLLGVAFVLDLAGFGVLWWQLLAWSAADVVTDGRVDVLVAIGAVNALAILVSVVAWFLLLLSVRRAQQYRRRALQTRHTHRMLRLQGIDPLDADVWWAMVHGRLNEVAPEADAADTTAATSEAWTQGVVPPEQIAAADHQVAARGSAPVDDRASRVVEPADHVEVDSDLPADDRGDEWASDGDADGFVEDGRFVGDGFVDDGRLVGRRPRDDARDGEVDRLHVRR